MTRHSKNNTAASVFTKAEHNKLKSLYGTQRARLGADSLRPFDACTLCLCPAVTPVACSKGHLFCRECALKDLVEQKAELERKKKELAQVRKEEERTRDEVRQKARERVLEQFERGQVVGFIGKRKERDEDGAGNGEPVAKRRKFEFDRDAAQRAAQEAEEAAIKQLEIEQNEARKAKLPDFWLPSLTPDAPNLISLKDVKLQTMCRASDPAHTMLMKHLTPVAFTVDGSPAPSSSSDKRQSEPAKKMCPSCKKELSNSSRIFLIKSCSHVICKTCTDGFVMPSSQCVACDGPAKPKDIIELVREGTGFAAGGRAETTKAGTAFQG